MVRFYSSKPFNWNNLFPKTSVPKIMLFHDHNEKKITFIAEPKENNMDPVTEEAKITNMEYIYTTLLFVKKLDIVNFDS